LLKVLSGSTRITKRLWSELLNVFSFSYVGFFLLGVLFSRAVLLGELYPFGVGFLVGVCIEKPEQRGVSFLGVLLGLLLTIKGFPLLGYLASIVVLSAVFFCYKKEELPWLIVSALIFAIHLLARGGIAFLTGSELYLWLGIIFESLFVCIFTLVTITGIRAYTKATEGSILTAEESTSLGLIILGIVLGVSSCSFLDYSLQSVLSRWLVLWGAFLGGTGGGAAIGAVVGLVPSVQGMFTVGPVAYYAIAGLLGGIFNSFKKIGVVVGFVLANLFLSFFFTESVVIVQALKETGAAVLVFLLFNIPVKMESFIAATHGNNTSGEILNFYYADKLEKIAQVFYDLERVLRSNKKKKTEKNKLKFLFNQGTSQVCAGCSLQRVCWEQNFYKTYRAVLEACTKLETQGIVAEEDFGTDFKRRCLRLRELRVALNSQLEVLKVVNFYEKQLDTCHLMVNRQLVGLAKIIEDFSGEIKQKIEREESLEGVLREKLREKGIHINQLNVVKPPGAEKEIHITQNACQHESLCTALVAPNISQVLERIFVLKNRTCIEKKRNGSCSYILVPSRALQITVGKASCPKEGLTVSGDHCSALTLPNHRFALIMCDGMGVGTEAQAESSLAVSVLEKFLLAGFSPQTAVRTVNTALLLKSSRENFATLDVAIINQINGQCDFIKIGGAPSLIRSARGLKVVQSSSPPVGILEEIEPQTFRHVLGIRNNIIMMSDGVWDVLDSVEPPEARLETLLSKFEIFDPQVVAEYILFMAKKAAGNQVPDDMCVIVAYIDKKA
jgi:stage II sporulation protein E